MSFDIIPKSTHPDGFFQLGKEIGRGSYRIAFYLFNRSFDYVFYLNKRRFRFLFLYVDNEMLVDRVTGGLKE